jgi:uncharacterized protein
MPTDNITFADSPAASRYELHVGGVLAGFAEYKLQDQAVMFTHTEVLPGHEGQGIGSKLARFALDNVRQRGLQVIPVCEFIAGYIQRRPEYQDLVTGKPQAGLEAQP